MLDVLIKDDDGVPINQFCSMCKISLNDATRGLRIAKTKDLNEVCHTRVCKDNSDDMEIDRETHCDAINHEDAATKDEDIGIEEQSNHGHQVDEDKLPRFSRLHGPCFPEVPDYILEMNPLEARLVAPKLAFGCIYQLRSGGQFGLKGGVVSVPSDLSKI